MTETLRDDELALQARRLLRLRIPLIAVLLVSCAMVIRVPFVQLGAAAVRVETTQVVANSAEGSQRPAVSDAANDQHGMPDSASAATTGALENATAPRSADPHGNAQLGEPRNSALPAETASTPSGASQATAASVVQTQPQNHGPSQRELESRPVQDSARVDRTPSQLDAAHIEIQSPEVADVSSARLHEKYSTLAKRAKEMFDQLALLGTDYHAPLTEDRLPQQDDSVSQASTPANRATNQPQKQSPAVIVRNPTETQAEIRYLVDGQLHSLLPGQSQQLAADRTWTIHFHRGGDFGNAKHLCAEGTYVFQISERGWELTKADDHLWKAQASAESSHPVLNRPKNSGL